MGDVRSDRTSSSLRGTLKSLEVLITSAGAWILSDESEAPRLHAEELPPKCSAGREAVRGYEHVVQVASGNPRPQLCITRHGGHLAAKEEQTSVTALLQVLEQSAVSDIKILDFEQKVRPVFPQHQLAPAEDVEFMAFHIALHKTQWSHIRRG